MSYPTLGRCSLVGTLASLLVSILVFGGPSVGIRLPIEVIFTLYPGAIFALAESINPSTAEVIFLRLFILFTDTFIYVFLSYLVFCSWRWWARRSPRA